MPARLIVLRPEPGNAATLARIAAAGGDGVAMPLFAVRPLDWAVPDPAAFDALLLTSANAVRHAGPGLARLSALPVVAVGGATANAARAAGLLVVATGSGDAQAAATLLRERGCQHPLHLAGREHRPVAGVTPITVYASEPVAPEGVERLTDAVALIHSPRAGARLAACVDAAGLPRARTAVAAISPAALAAAGGGWRRAITIDRPNDDALVRAALSIDPGDGGGDKAA
ncbi:uroporphyrinogen-III synthase [Sphingomonas sp.]|uniref:uroporphyrinogen-III synthase n=1 Tax=Sphingomonas sp. TaxID=28214 RepID=UPI002C1F6B4E|nr:uroporphyrinogen-III synthase [Sphingomonas sp.]HTG37445.1 uroporphyrinogen-III synthase [Sphingomonas sp.]